MLFVDAPIFQPYNGTKLLVNNVMVTNGWIFKTTNS